MRALHGTAFYLLLTACASPDRWSLTGGSTLAGGLESADGQRSFDSQWLEAGVSGAIGSPPERRGRREAPCPIQQPSAPIAQPEKSGGIPWEQILLVLGGAAGLEGSRHAHRKVKAYRAKRQKKAS